MVEVKCNSVKAKNNVVCGKWKKIRDKSETCNIILDFKSIKCDKQKNSSEEIGASSSHRLTIPGIFYLCVSQYKMKIKHFIFLICCKVCFNRNKVYQ